MNTLQASTAKPFSPVLLNLRLDYDYSTFGSQELQTEALETLQQFFSFVQHTFVTGLEIGRSFRQILQELCEENGSTEGAQLFDEWLESSDFGGSTWMARSLIQISEWFDGQRQRIQKLILNSVQSWSISAVKELTKISDEHLLVKLLKSGKQTVASIRQTRKTITLGQPATLADWRLISYASCEMDEESLATLQAEALRLAQMSQPNAAEPVVLTDHLVEAVQTLTDWNISKLIKSQHKRKTNPAISAFLANCASSDEVVPEAQLKWIERGLGLDPTASQEFRACVQNLAQAEAGNSGKAVAKHHHLQQALAQQKLAPAVPKSPDRVAQLERQVRDLSAQLKEADKATALIHALQAQRDRLEQENQELQGLIQENAQKDLEIHLLQQQLAQVEATRSDAVLEQLRQQNQQLLSQLDQTQQRYDALASEMAASKQNMKYSDNSTLVAKVMALEAELAEQTQNSQQPTTPAQNPQVETYKSLLAQMAHPIPASPVNEGDRVLVVKPEHPATGEFVTVTTEPDSVNFVNIQTDAGATWHICAEDLRLEGMLGDRGLDSISETFAAAASKQCLPGWTEKGYRSPYGLFYRGWAAIAQFAESVLQSESAVFMG
ncbi:hypothetical protein [Laspinema olomoucense]|uniref:Uncharacterized protein n=1 Tax=Laspinema olomoucense D3b TaxID=2953688 RepID=A0ABT2N4U7_9CYAN|nr:MULTISPECIES: hypothetical protein [unclassified Laspinema]MCT7977708.1 hypothetical protein [Laspinema sp. D3b]MCT7992553.1 hypothetical protein [Laspinema sp. D3c]